MITTVADPEAEARAEQRKAIISRRLTERVARFDSLPDSADVRVDVVATLLDCSRVTVYRRAHAGDLPMPINGKVNVGALRAARKRQAAPRAMRAAS